MDNMHTVLQAINEVQQAHGSKAKTAVLHKYCRNDTFKRILYYALHPHLSYKISEDKLYLRPALDDDFHNFSDLWEVCDCLARNRAVSNLLLDGVLHFLWRQPDDIRNLYIKVISKTLRIGLTHKTINNAYSGLFPEWNVQQAYTIEKHPLKEGTWFALTQKLNGVRCTYYRGQMVARSGEPFIGLDHIIEELSDWPDLVFDGELTLKEKGSLTDNEAFRTATGIINSDGDKTGICFTIFDLLPAYEFDAGVSSATYRERRTQLDRLHEELKDAQYTSVISALYQGDDQSMVTTLLDRMVAEDKEGLMVNLDVPYKCKRHSGILKVKRFYTMDLPIIRIEEGSGKNINTTGAIIVDYKGNEVGVGTGLTDEQRDWFWIHQDDVVGTLVEVKYKEISYDKQSGGESLQFPVFVRLRTEKSDISYD